MPFPFSISGRVEIGEQCDPARLAARIEHELEWMRMKRINRAGLCIHFVSGRFTRWRKTRLDAVSSGELCIEPATRGLVVAYRVRFTKILLIVTACVLVIFGPFTLADTSLSQIQKACWLGGAWLWLYGGNVVLTYIRFPRWIRRIIGTHDEPDR